MLKLACRQTAEGYLYIFSYESDNELTLEQEDLIAKMKAVDLSNLPDCPLAINLVYGQCSKFDGSVENKEPTPSNTAETQAPS